MPDSEDPADTPAPEADTDATAPVADPTDQATVADPAADPTDRAEPAGDPEDATEVVTTDDATEVFSASDATEVLPTEHATEVFKAETSTDAPPERRYTAPGFDAKETEAIQTAPDQDTEVFARAQRSGRVGPQLIPPGLSRRLPASIQRSWGWVLALALIILMLAAIAVVGTIWLARGGMSKVSQEDRVRNAIENFDVAVQTGDLAALRGLTCGSARDNYLNYNEEAWRDTYRRVSETKQYPVVASIDEIVINGHHAEANVTAFMAYAPQVRSTRSFDLQFRDDQWKICQSPAG